MKIWVTQLTVKIGIKISIVDFDFHSFNNVPVVFYLAKTLFVCFWLARRGVVNVWVMPVGFIGYVWRSYKYRELNQDWTRTPLQTAASPLGTILEFVDSSYSFWQLGVLLYLASFAGISYWTLFGFFSLLLCCWCFATLFLWWSNQ